MAGVRREWKGKKRVHEVREREGLPRRLIWKMMMSTENKELLVFSVMPFKTDQNQNQNHSIDNVQILRKERR